MTDVLRFLSGHWPNPPMGDDEIRVWTMTLAPLDLHCATETIDLISQAGRTWRPNDGEFLAAYRIQRARGPKLPPIAKPDLPQLPVTTESKTPEEWMTKIRSQLRHADGPLKDDLSEALS